ncbi:hypothetical protein [Amycolatopsis sp. DG1A-15b]|uniref:hypothetical protein n=1 Tax=Amycolatopsis sp. DG1A-15b TaxID=3052846 RepID=UPI00255B459B|nr:hypothetical protein [Amycolatopsis sp. DG1A-15b]WIX88228.1 hypothetical protein QRY02_45115 [Amycolatopsis sp. DG1A-15b]
MNPDEIRAAVLYALNRLYLPIAADDLSLVTRLVKGVDVAEADLDDLAEADRAGFRAGDERPVWICPALEYPDGKANEGFFTRSDWPIQARIVRGGVPSKSKDLFLLRHLCDLAMSADTGEALRESLRERIDDLTIHFTESRLAERRAEHSKSVDDLEFYREFAEDLYGEVVRQEREAQRDAIEALERLPLPVRYFGVS